MLKNYVILFTSNPRKCMYRVQKIRKEVGLVDKIIFRRLQDKHMHLDAPNSTC